jgi:hypothetical protein
LIGLLARDLASRQSAPTTRIKRHAKRPSRQHLDLLIDQITRLNELGGFTTAITGIPASKLRSLAAQTMSLDRPDSQRSSIKLRIRFRGRVNDRIKQEN